MDMSYIAPVSSLRINNRSLCISINSCCTSNCRNSSGTVRHRISVVYYLRIKCRFKYTCARVKRDRSQASIGRNRLPLCMESDVSRRSKGFSGFTYLIFSIEPSHETIISLCCGRQNNRRSTIQRCHIVATVCFERNGKRILDCDRFQDACTCISGLVVKY